MFCCLNHAVENNDKRVEEWEAAWSKLSAAEVKELTREGGKLYFDDEEEYAPLHDSSAYGNQPGVEFLLVSKWREIRRI